MASRFVVFSCCVQGPILDLGATAKQFRHLCGSHRRAEGPVSPTQSSISGGGGVLQWGCRSHSLSPSKNECRRQSRTMCCRFCAAVVFLQGMADELM